MLLPIGIGSPTRFLTDLQAYVRYYLAEHPTVSHFRWDHNAWGSSWVFLFLSIALYLFVIGFLELVLGAIKRKRPLPLGPIPAIHNLIELVMSLLIFVGCWEATVVEIKETRWIWRKSKSDIEWILCFPLGIRPAGRVFFWSYVFYLTKYYNFMDTFIWILQRKPPTFLLIFHRIMVVCMCFLWLEFSQSLQILSILTDTLVHVVRYSNYLCGRVDQELALPYTKFVANCYIFQMVFTFLAYIGLLRLHFTKEGCNGMGAWLFNAALFAGLSLLWWNSHLKKLYDNTKKTHSMDRSLRRKKNVE